jgi:hypothetical protein
MRLTRWRGRLVRGAVVLLVILACAWALVVSERRRTEAEFSAVLSAYLSNGVLRDVHDRGPGRGILIVLQREAQQPGSWRWRWLFPFDRDFKFAQSSIVTRSSFALSNALPTRLRVVLRLPTGVSGVFVGRSELEQSEASGEFQRRFPNSLGYLAVSQAGLNLNRTEAIFYIDDFCGLCGGGRYVLMHKINGVWSVVDEHYTWVS